MENTLRFLKKIPGFRDLNRDTLRLVQEVLQPMTFEEGERLCTEGETGDRMFIIESGEVAVLKNVEAGDPIEVALLKSGDIAGEMGLFGQKTRSATLETCKRCKVWILDYVVFEALLEQHGELAKGLLSYMSEHLARETSIAAKLMAKDIEKGLRVAFFHTTPYRNHLYRTKNCYNYAMHFFTPRLTLETAPLAAGFRVIVVSANDCLDAEVIEELSALGVEMIALRCAGFNNVDLSACERRGISVARVPAYSPYAVAEHAVALMMGLNRRIHRAHSRVREGNFSLDGLVGFDMHGRTAGIVGTGKIGCCLLSILHGFGCRLLAYDIYQNQDFVDRLGVRYVELSELFAESDIISLHAPLTPKTHHMIDAEAVAKMKPGVMLINTARGALIDSEALIDGLKSGQVGYAGLDVYEEEGAYFFEDFSNRVITDDVLARLTTFNNVMITGHQGSLTDVAQENIVETTIENIREFESGKRRSELTNAVVAPS
jgi:D-lactate dehydrogenase